MNLLPDNFFVCLDLFLDWETYEQARRFVRGVHNYSKQDATYSLVLAVIDLLEGNLQEALRNFSELLEHRTLSLAALTGQMCVYEKQEIRDSRSMEKLQSLRSQAKSHAEPDGLYLSSWLLFRLGKYIEADECVHGILQTHSDHGQAQTLLALLEMRSGGSPSKVKAHLDSAIKLSGDHVCQAHLAFVHWCLQQNELDQAQTEMRAVSATWDKLLPVRAANITVQMSLRNWEGVADATDRLLALDPQVLIGHFFTTLSLVYTSNSAKRKDLDRTMQTLLEKLQKAEPKNPSLLAKYARICSLVAHGDEKILENTLPVLQQMTLNHATNGDCLLEAGNELILLGKSEEARGYFQRAMKFPAFVRAAMIGETNALIRLGLLEQADKHCDRLGDLLKLESSEGPSGQRFSDQLVFLRILIQSRQELGTNLEPSRGTGLTGRSDGVSKRLSELLVAHLQHVKTQTFNLDFVLRIDPIYVGDLIQEILQHCPTQPLKFIAEDSIIRQCENLLSFLNSSTPGLTDLTVLLARVSYLKNDLLAAGRLLEAVIDSERFGINSSAFTSAAEVYLAQGNLAKAKTSLDRALANSFAVKNSLRFLCLQALFLRLSGQLSECIKLLSTALERPGVPRPTGTTSSSSETLQDRCSVFLDLADAYSAGKDSKKALTILSEADTLFRGTSQSACVVLARADYLAAISLKSKTVMDLLQSVNPDVPDFYHVAQEKLAMYYLKNGMKNEYVLLYERLFEQMGETPAASIMLGNAYLKIPMARQAVEVIQAAIKRQPGNVKLESAMGNVLTRCHLFANALNYYEAAVKKGNRNVRPDYVSLLIKLKRYERVEELLIGFTAEDSSDLDDQMRTARFLNILADIQQILGKLEDQLITYRKAQLFLEKLNVRLRRENPDASLEVRRLLLGVFDGLSDLALAAGDYPAALQLSRQAQTQLLGEDRIPALLRQARIHLQQSDTGEAFRLAKEVQKIQPDNREALKLTGDIAFRRKDLEMASSTYREFFRAFPDDLLTVASIIPLMARITHLHFVKPFLDEQKRRVSRGNKSLYQLCMGLYLRYTGDVKSAVATLFRVVKEPECGLVAVQALVELLCNWDIELISSQNLPASLRQTRIMPACQMILKDLPASLTSSMNYFHLRCLPILAGGSTSDLSGLVSELEPIELAEDSPVAKSYILVTALLLLGLKDRALPVLRRFDKTIWNMQDAEYLERMWLLLAEQLDINNRGDEVSQLVFRSMEFNKGLYMVNMFEGFHCGVQNFPKAAECFRRAFDTTDNRDFISGERYCWAQLNANRPMDVVEGLDLLERAIGSRDTAGDASARKDDGGAMSDSIQAMRLQALGQLSLRADDKPGRAEAAARRQSRA